MKKLAFTAMFMGALGLTACSSSSSDDQPDAGTITFTDANNNGGPDATTNTAACNAVANTGCAANEKCTFIVESTDPFLGRTDCAADGSVALGGMCARAMDGVDDCVGGTWCLGSVCSEICSSAPDSCASGTACVQFVDLFEDADGVGICQPECDPLDLANTCPTGEGCYVNLSTGSGTCATPAGGAEGFVQGDDCMFLNGCAVGYGCTLNNDPVNATGLECAYFCDPNMGTGPTCAEGPGPSFTCIAIQMFYNNAMNVDPNLGFCIDCAAWGCEST